MCRACSKQHSKPQGLTCLLSSHNRESKGSSNIDSDIGF
ncbi:hypothetical protein D046_0266B, partial [Vibrio parahaemolyticus V-223/04]